MDQTANAPGVYHFGWALVPRRIDKFIFIARQKKGNDQEYVAMKHLTSTRVASSTPYRRQLYN